MRKTKIIATLGPSSQSYESVKSLIETGLDAARINFSHGSHEEHKVKIDLVKKVREELGKHIPLVLDTKGPEIRTKDVEPQNVQLKKGNEFTLTTDDIIGDSTKVAVTYKGLAMDLKVGATVLIDDGLIELKVKEIKGNDVICDVVNDGVLGCKKGVNLPDVNVNLPAITEKDEDDIKFGIEMDFDYIAASFIRSAADVKMIRKVLDENGGKGIQIISKIENREGINNIDEILEVTDGLMVARGDLGVEIPFEEVPVIQKKLIRKCKERGKLVITATQMLESMIKNPRPTRAEASDVANAVFDGTDAIMLSGETAKGDYPVEAVATMVKIAEKVESSIDYIERFNKMEVTHRNNITNAISRSACTSANTLGAACLITVTSSGYTVRQVSKFRPISPILALSPNDRVLRQLNLVWGCYPYKMDMVLTNANDLFDSASQKSIEYGFAKPGDILVIVGGTPIGTAGTTNTIKIHVAGDIIVHGKGNGKEAICGTVSVITEKTENFKEGNIVVCKRTTDEMVDMLKKAAGIVVGTGKNENFSHAESVARTLDIPLLVSEQSVTDIIPDTAYVKLDAIEGTVRNQSL